MIFILVSACVAGVLSMIVYAILTTNEMVDGRGWISFIFVAIWALLMAGWDSNWAVKERYATTANGIEVKVESQPSDCDFLRAPVGTKGCHYEREVRKYVTVKGTTIPDHEFDPKVDNAPDEIVVGWARVETN